MKTTSSFCLTLVFLLGSISILQSQTFGTTAAIQPFYIGDDQGANYLAQHEKSIFWVAEHPIKKYCILFKGKIEGKTISGKWRALPKYGSKDKGTLKATLSSNNHIKVVEETGGFPLSSLKPTNLSPEIVKQLPGTKRPVYAASEKQKMTGAIKSNKDVTCYMRQIDDRVFMFCESDLSASKKPMYAYAFVGRKQAKMITGRAIALSKSKQAGSEKAIFYIQNDGLTRESNFDMGGKFWKRTYPNYQKQINQYIRQLSYNADELLKLKRIGQEGGKKKLGDKKQTSTADGETVNCTVESWDYKKNIQGITVVKDFNLYPGALVKINQEFVKGNPQVVSAINQRKQTYSSDLPGLPTGKVQFSAQPKLSTYRGKLNEHLNWWLNNKYTKGYHNKLDSEEVTGESWSKKQLALDLNLNYQSLSGNASSQFSQVTTQENYVFYAYYKQVYYTVNVDQPEKPAQWFTQKTTLQQVKNNYKAKAPLGYVSSVKYGRIMLITLKISTSEKFIDARNAVNWLVGNGKISGEVNVKYSNILKNAQVEARMYGGATESISFTGSQLIPEQFDAIKSKNLNFSKSNPGAPIEYEVRFVKNNKVAKIGLATSFETTKCETIPTTIKLKQDGGYLGMFIVRWLVDGEQTEKIFWDKPMTWQHVLSIPLEATNISVIAKAKTGVTKKESAYKTLYHEAGHRGCTYKLLGATVFQAKHRVIDCEQ